MPKNNFTKLLIGTTIMLAASSAYAGPSNNKNKNKNENAQQQSVDSQILDQPDYTEPTPQHPIQEFEVENQPDQSQPPISGGAVKRQPADTLENYNSINSPDREVIDRAKNRSPGNQRKSKKVKNERNLQDNLDERTNETRENGSERAYEAQENSREHRQDAEHRRDGLENRNDADHRRDGLENGQDNNNRDYQDHDNDHKSEAEGKAKDKAKKTGFTDDLRDGKNLDEAKGEGNKKGWFARWWDNRKAKKDSKKND